MLDFSKIGVVNLSDVFPTRLEYSKDLKRIGKKIGNCEGSIFLLSIVLGILIWTVTDQMSRIEKLEKNPDKTGKAADSQ